MAENVDSSYYAGGDTLGGAYLGQDYNRSGYYVPSWIKSDKEDVRGSDPYAQIALNPGTMYRLVDYSGENEGTVLGQGSTLADIEAMQKIINEQLVPLGRKADWRIQEVSNAPIDPATGMQTYATGSSIDPQTGQYYTTLGGDYYNKPSIAGPIADIALPLAMNFLIPGSGLLHGALTAAGGSLLSGIAQGKPIGDIAKGALISGIGGGIGGSLGGAGIGGGGSVAGGATGATTGALGSGIGSAVGGIADDAIINVLANTLGSGVGGAVGAGLGGALGSIAGGGGGYQQQPGDFPMVTATGVRPVATGSLAGMGGIGGVGALGIEAANRALAEQAAQQAAADQNAGKEIVVNVGGGGSALVPAVGLGGLGLAGLGAATSGGGSAAAPIAETFNPEMVVTASPDGGLIIPPAVPSAGLNPGSLLPAAVPLVVSPTTLPKPPRKPLTVSDYINMARGGLGVVGGLFGGGGDQGGLPAGFNANTGTVTYTPLNRTQNVTPFDPFTYGQATGERSFFNPYELEYKTNVPSAQTTRTPTFKEGGEAEFDDSIEGHLAAYYSDGGHAGPGPVKGIGSGQEDKIPAWLSDGEYVWSAQDVSDLGDGSSDEGIRRLDKMRQMVRKGAGRKDTKSIARPQKGIEVMIKEVGGAA